jgi:hypothetical protein
MSVFGWLAGRFVSKGAEIVQRGWDGVVYLTIPSSLGWGFFL